MFRYSLSRPMIALLAASLLTPVFALGGGAKKQDMSGEKVTQHGCVNWDKGVLYATGLGAISNQESNQAKAYLRARGFAKLDALRNLLMVVDHVRIDSQTTGADYEAVSDQIKADVHGVVMGAQVVNERQIPMGKDTMVEVTVATPMYGDRGIARVVVPEIAHHNEEIAPPSGDSGQIEGVPEENHLEVRAVPPTPVKVQIERHDELNRSNQEGPATPGDRYTSLIVDARGLGVDRCMSPKIRRPDGSEVWGSVHVNLDWLIEHGIVVYAHSIAEARRHPRAGDAPLIVRALGRAGGKFNSDAVVSGEDADAILSANGSGGFLDQYHVIFVVDPGH